MDNRKLGLVMILIGWASGLWAAEHKTFAKTYSAPYEITWKAASTAWDSMYFPTLRRDSKQGILESDTIRIPGDTAKAWMGDVPPKSWWQEGRYVLTLSLKPSGKAHTRVKAEMWIFARGVPNPAMVSLRPHIGISNGTLENRVLERIAKELGPMISKTK